MIVKLVKKCGRFAIGIASAARYHLQPNVCRQNTRMQIDVRRFR
jgi:hypothetical protein